VLIIIYAISDHTKYVLPSNQECTKCGVSTQAQALEYLDSKVRYYYSHSQSISPFTQNLSNYNICLSIGHSTKLVHVRISATIKHDTYIKN
jgi:hypothetical protein